jgi:hypothetical protein
LAENRVFSGMSSEKLRAVVKPAAGASGGPQEDATRWSPASGQGGQRDSAAQTAPAVADIDLSRYHQVDDLASVGTPRLKSALRARGMATGGRSTALAERLWWKSKMSHFADSSRRYQPRAPGAEHCMVLFFDPGRGQHRVCWAVGAAPLRERGASFQPPARIAGPQIAQPGQV